MRHYFGYDNTGAIKSIEIITFGFTDEHRFTDPDCDHPVVAPIQARRADIGVNSFIAYDCPCLPEKRVCNCPHQKFSQSFVDNGSLVDRYTYDILLDDSPVNDGDTIINPPGTQLVLKLSNSNAPDSTQVNLQDAAAVAALSENTSLTISGGESGTLNIYTPAQGMTACVVIYSDKMVVKKIYLKGFAV